MYSVNQKLTLSFYFLFVVYLLNIHVVIATSKLPTSEAEYYFVVDFSSLIINRLEHVMFIYRGKSLTSSYHCF